MRQPNLLLIMSDQHNPHVLGCAGDPVVRTPHLDRMAAEGVLFERTYCAGPLCVPSRMTFLTSQFPSDIDVWTNGCILSSDVPTFAHSLSLAGYETVLCGRMHFVGPDQHHGFEHRLVGDVTGAVELGTEGWKGLFEGKIPTYTTGQTHEGVKVAGPGRTTYTAYDEEVTRVACEWLRRRDAEQPDRPFCLVVGYLMPHCPYVCPRPLFDEYVERVEVPALPAGYLDGLHPAVRHWRETRGVDGITREQARVARAAYYGMVTFLDHNVGEVMAALRATRLAAETAAAYTSDHGEMAGEHGMWWKDSFYEGSVGVPMIWSWPERFAAEGRVQRVASLLDIGPTCLDLAGAEPLPAARGRSLRGFLEPGAGPTDWPDAAFAETFAAHERPARMLCAGDWKLNVYYGCEAPQLFHLASDPGEVRDLGRSEEHAHVRDELVARASAGWSGERVERAVASRRAGSAVVRRWRAAVKPGISEVWRIPRGCNVFPEA